MTSSIVRHLAQNRPFETLEEEVFVGLQLAAARLMEPWARHLRETAELTDVQYNVLRVLRGAGPEGMRVQAVACRLITRSPDVTRLVDRLEARGLVRRSVDEGDGRAVRLRITEAGLARIAPLDEGARRFLMRAMKGMDRAGLEALRDSLGEVLDATVCEETDQGRHEMEGIPDEREAKDGEA
jgi:DNA-binding MarR family transcriptional regulator